jgi:RNA polymerase sigma-70 factor (ECF subfamily)
MATGDVTHDDLRPLLFSLAYRMVGVVGEAEDLVQELTFGCCGAARGSTSSRRRRS